MGRLAAQQRIIVSSIHQPRAAIWELFSKVTVLSEGRMLYFGAISQVGWLSPWIALEYVSLSFLDM